MEFKYATYCLDDEYELDEIAFKGKCFVYSTPDGYFAKYGYISDIMINPTWKDIMFIADNQIEATGDYHHVFLEGIETIKEVSNDIYEISLILGS